MLLRQMVFAQSGEITNKGITFPSYTTLYRPSANSVGIGTILYNKTDNTHQYSNGSAWLNLSGTTTLPSGMTNQTLRNNGSGWVVDGLLQNTGSKILIGPDNGLGNALLTVNSVGYTGVSIYSIGFTALTGQSDNNIAISGSSINYIGVYGVSTNHIGIYGESSNSIGVLGISDSNVGVYGYSEFSYGGKFQGRLRLKRGGNGDAGIELENSIGGQAGYVGMNGNNEMMIFGYGLDAAIQRWNIVTGTICYVTSPTICSDIRLKKAFRPLMNSTDKLSMLNGYNYYWKNEKQTGLQTGFIAQDVQKIFPELVQTDSNGYLSVDYVGLIPHLVEANKLLKTQNEEMLARLEVLEKKLLSPNQPSISTKITDK